MQVVEIDASDKFLGVLPLKYMVSRRLQCSKQKAPSDVTDEGIVTEGKLLQCQYLQPIITQYFIDNKSEIWLLFLIAHSKR